MAGADSPRAAKRPRTERRSPAHANAYAWASDANVARLLQSLASASVAPGDPGKTSMRSCAVQTSPVHRRAPLRAPAMSEAPHAAAWAGVLAPTSSPRARASSPPQTFPRPAGPPLRAAPPVAVPAPLSPTERAELAGLAAPAAGQAAAAAADDRVSPPRRAARTWTDEEDLALLEAVEQHGRRWTAVARMVGSRDARQCSNRFGRISTAAPRRQPWTPAEDDLLRALVGAGERSWTRIAEAFAERGLARHRDRIAERYNNHLRPDLVRTPFTPDEDARLKSAVRDYGAGGAVRWGDLQREVFPHRSYDLLRSRWKSLGL